jgi:hypothetical protein
MKGGLAEGSEPEADVCLSDLKMIAPVLVILRRFTALIGRCRWKRNSGTPPLNHPAGRVASLCHQHAAVGTRWSDNDRYWSIGGVRCLCFAASSAYAALRNVVTVLHSSVMNGCLQGLESTEVRPCGKQHRPDRPTS